MNEKVVRKYFRWVYNQWHQCALKAPLHKEDKARGLKVGQLCDDCEDNVKAIMKDIEDES